ncbi:MAG TPA: hypothetical protein VMS12_04410 [Thermoanaerobaculia bacterium]|nr:hypothetical protein [Thermoanaerobaculia bacterium]
MRPVRILLYVATFAWLAVPTPAQARDEHSSAVSAILFLGNSLTYGNDLPGIVCRLAAESGSLVHCDAVARADFALVDHWNERAAANKLKRRKWSVVVMQQGPSGGHEGRELLLEYGKKWSTRVTDAGGRPAFFMVWPAVSRSQDFPRVSESYRMAADQTGGIVLPAGDAWLEAWRRDRSLKLYGPDGFHPSLAGSYLAALSIYRGIFGELPASFADVEVANRAARGNLGLSEEQLRILLDAAIATD